MENKNNQEDNRSIEEMARQWFEKQEKKEDPLERIQKGVAKGCLGIFLISLLLGILISTLTSLYPNP